MKIEIIVKYFNIIKIMFQRKIFFFCNDMASCKYPSRTGILLWKKNYLNERGLSLQQNSWICRKNFPTCNFRKREENIKSHVINKLVCYLLSPKIKKSHSFQSPYVEFAHHNQISSQMFRFIFWNRKYLIIPRKNTK